MIFYCITILANCIESSFWQMMLNLWFRINIQVCELPTVCLTSTSTELKCEHLFTSWRRPAWAWEQVNNSKEITSFENENHLPLHRREYAGLLVWIFCFHLTFFWASYVVLQKINRQNIRIWIWSYGFVGLENPRKLAFRMRNSFVECWLLKNHIIGPCTHSPVEWYKAKFIK